MDPATREFGGKHAMTVALLAGVVFLLAALAGTSFLIDDGSAADTEHPTVDGETAAGAERRLSAMSAGADGRADWQQSLERQLRSVAGETTPRSGARSRVYDRLTGISVRDAIAGAYLVNATDGTVLVSAGSAVTDPGGTRLQSNLVGPLAAATNRSGRVAHSRPFERPDATPAVLAVAATPDRNGPYVVAVVDLAALSAQFGDDRNQNPPTQKGGRDD